MTTLDLRTALLISGSGSTAKVIIKATQTDQLPGINPVVVIASQPNIQGLSRAIGLGIPTAIIEPKAYSDSIRFGTALLHVCHQFKVNLISQNGWLPLTPMNLVDIFQGHIINQHPGPLDPPHPDFGGKGMYGSRVTAARLLYLSFLSNQGFLDESDLTTQAVTHFVTPKYDKGELIKITPLALTQIFDPSLLVNLATDHQLLLQVTRLVQQALLPLEHQNVIDTLLAFTRGEVSPYHQPHRLIPPKNIHILRQAKQLAIKVFPL